MKLDQDADNSKSDFIKVEVSFLLPRLQLENFRGSLLRPIHTLMFTQIREQLLKAGGNCED